MREFTRPVLEITEEEYIRLLGEDIYIWNLEVVFDRGTYEADEGFTLDDGHFYGSSYSNGIVRWKDGQYILMYHQSHTELGQIRHFHIHDEEEIQKVKDLLNA